MAINKYFNLHNANNKNQNEQNLINNLVSECIQQLGFDVQYIPQALVNEDPLFHENPDAVFNKAITIEAYIDTVDGFEGNGDLMQQFGLDIQDQTRFVFSQTRFKAVTNTVRPMEGDLIYSPLSKSLFEIKFVEHESVFYANGTLPSFMCKCEKYQVSGEVFNTGIADVDAINNVADAFSDNVTTETAGIAVQDFSEQNPFGDARG